MGWILDFLQEVPTSAVLRERVALADQKYEAALRENEQLKRKVEALERENAELRTQIPQIVGIGHGIERGFDSVVTCLRSVNLVYPVAQVFAGEVPALLEAIQKGPLERRHVSVSDRPAP